MTKTNHNYSNLFELHVTNTALLAIIVIHITGIIYNM